MSSGHIDLNSVLLASRGDRRGAGHTRAVDDLLARVPEDDLLVLDGLAVVAGGADVGDHDLRVGRGDRVGGAAAAGDLDIGAVHVHLTVALQVEPGPGEQRLAVGDVAGHLEVVLGRQRAAALHRLDDVEVLAVVVAERQLARAAAVRGRAGERHVVGLTGLVGGHGAPGGVVLVSLAGEVGACKVLLELCAFYRCMCGQTISIEWARHGVVNVAVVVVRIELAAQRVRPAHLHMGGNQTGREETENSFEEHFVKYVFAKYVLRSRSEQMREAGRVRNEYRERSKECD